MVNKAIVDPEKINNRIRKPIREMVKNFRFQNAIVDFLAFPGRSG
jgi:hypothetical protein